MSKPNFNLSFDELVDLYQNNPTEFEEYRKARLEEQILDMCGGSKDREDKCRRFIWRMEGQLSKYKDPIARYNKMVELFWEQVETFRQATDLQSRLKETILKTNTTTNSNNILKFRRK